MPSLTSTLAATAGLLNIAYAAAVAPQPKVVGFEFSKHKRHISEHPRLAKRLNTVQAGLANYYSLYQINVTVGTPPQSIGLQLDTGSSDIWFPYSGSDDCQQGECEFGSFDPDSSSTFEDLAQDAFEIQYVDGTQIYGDYISETLRIGDTDITNLTMGLATQTGGSAEGIMGVGFVSDETIAQTDPEDTYPNIPVQLQRQGYINTIAYSLWLNDLSSSTGNILFGGVDTAKYHGDLIGLPIQPDSTSGDITSFTVALSSLNITNSAGKSVYGQSSLALPAILDSGTTLTYLPDDIANDIIQGVGAVDYDEFGYVTRCNLGQTGANITFGFGGANGPIITVGMDEMVIPILDNSGSPLRFRNGDTACSFGINPAGSDPILFGDTFLRSAYVVYDLHNDQIALANTNFNATSSNVKEITNSTIPGVSTVVSDVTVTQTATGIIHQSYTNSIATGTATETGNVGSGTFDLGSASSTSTSGSSKGAAVGLPAPRMALSTALTGVAVVVGMMFGGSLMILI